MKLEINFQNCYGISELKHSFDFSVSKGYAIYAPNGFMKTSFSKTFDDFAKENTTSDLVFPDRVSSRTIKNGNGGTISADSVFVIEPYNQEFSSEKASTLLVNKKIKQQYDGALKNISKKQAALFAKLKQLSGLTGRTITPETEILKCFKFSRVSELIESLQNKIDEGQSSELANLASIVYSEVFNEKTNGLIESGAIENQLEEYIKKYNELVSKSDVLSKKFNHYCANTVNKQLKDNGFFAAEHTVNLKTKGGRQEISSAEELTKKIEDERQKILSDETLSKKFDDIDKKIQNTELRQFRDYLFDNQHLLPHLKNFKQFKIDIWIAYLIDQKDLFNELSSEYKQSKAIIEEAIVQAKAEKTEWEQVVKIFHERFSVPFTMSVTNQDDVILKDTKPSISFKFDDGEGQGNISKNELLTVLSQGEKRALYILNILFEVQSRQKIGTPTVLIVDDIADSFDYKNKYAIIEYLKEVCDSGQFYCIFLSHNFDFYRSIVGRIPIKRKAALLAIKSGRKIILSEKKYLQNPFSEWKKHLTEPVYCISAIPFVRNLAEYCGYDAEYSKLTSLLHEKDDTHAITLGELCAIYKKVLVDKATLSLEPANKLVYDVLIEEAEKIIAASDESIELEGKIVLSIAIRLLAEKHMIALINNPAFVTAIDSNQTIKLLEEYKNKNLGSPDKLSILARVNLMTPENIHLNSFMYEPILDLGICHLKTLYADVKALT